MQWAVFAVLAVAVLFLAYVRLAGHDPKRWHVDPLTAQKPRKPNSFFLRENAKAQSKTYAVSAAELAAAFERIALAAPRTEKLAGSVDEGWVTYVSRTNLLRYPDYISVRFLDVEGGSQLAIFSRSRYGYSDRGVNKARVQGWLKRLDEALGL